MFVNNSRCYNCNSYDDDLDRNNMGVLVYIGHIFPGDRDIVQMICSKCTGSDKEAFIKRRIERRDFIWKKCANEECISAILAERYLQSQRYFCYEHRDF